MTISPYNKLYDGYEYEGFSCHMKSDDVSAMEKEWKKYQNKSGEIYEKSIYKYPTFQDFFNIYFRVEDGEYYSVPNVFTCSNYKVMDRMMQYLKHLEYHDTMRQSYCTLRKDDKIFDTRCIFIEYGDY